MSASQPAWSQQFNPDVLRPASTDLPTRIDRDWAWGDATGAGIKVAVVDSGIDATHPLVGGVAGGVVVEVDPGQAGGVRFTDGAHDDLFGHGTACAGIIRRVAPDALLYSVRVLGATLKGTGTAFLAGIRWALDNGMHAVNLSLSTRNRDHFAPLHDLADQAYFRNVMLISAINNVNAPSYPSQYSSVLSVAARAGTSDPFSLAYNPTPPVEIGAPGIDIEVAWPGDKTRRVTGNSFAAAHITGLTARILSKHPTLTPFQLKTVLRAVADNSPPASLE